MSETLDKENYRKVHNAELYKPFHESMTSDEARQILYAIAKKLVEEGISNQYTVCHCLQMIRDVRYPYEEFRDGAKVKKISNNDIKKVVFGAIGKVHWNLKHGKVKNKRKNSFKVKVKTEIYPSENQLRAAHKGYPITSEKVVEVYNKRSRNGR